MSAVELIMNSARHFARLGFAQQWDSRKSIFIVKQNKHALFDIENLKIKPLWDMSLVIISEMGVNFCSLARYTSERVNEPVCAF